MMAMTRPSILVVEDFAQLRSSVMHWLRVRFPWFHINGVGSAEEALEHARVSRPDVVLMDIDLPGINGIEATSLLRVRSPGTAVVMLTMHDTPSHRQAAASAGAAAYVTKVEIEDKLGSTLEDLLGARARRPS
jgi:DNA-binding NarL/FixJ family response regulator